MSDLPTGSEITEAVGLLAPGLIILAIRNRFKGRESASFQDQVLSYAVASAAYYAAAFPFFHADNGIKIWPWAWRFFQYFLIPCFVGGAVVFLDQSELFFKVCKRLGLRLTHHMPAAWDYAFSRCSKGTYILVKLQDGTLYSGLVGRNSFASTSLNERDLLIEEVWTFKGEGEWSVLVPKRSVLLCGKDIRWVEFFARRESDR